MAKLSIAEIRKFAVEIIRANPGGIRYQQLREQIRAQHPETPANTIAGSIWDLDVKMPSEVQKPSRGLYVPATGQASGQKESDQLTRPADLKKEEQFYEPFAEWLQRDLNEATIAAPIGGAGLKSKWGTPDVVGVYKPLAKDRIKFPLEVISAEIKIDPYQPVVAFGQAVAYRLFSSKAYVVMPRTITQEDLSRLEGLCMLFGVGLVLFDLNVDDPRFEIRVRAQRFAPDMFYVNEFAERLHQHNPASFQELFG
jgi:hypothetical protein